MKIVIIGAGFTGTQLARRLISEKNDVVLIEHDSEIVRHASNRLDCMVIQSDGNSLTTLEDAGIAKADALVALTDSDEVNMITCSLVDAVYPRVLKIARVRNYEYYANTKAALDKYAAAFQGRGRPLYGIDAMVHPDVEAAQAIIRAVEYGASANVLAFGGSDYVLTRVTVETGSRLDGIKVLEVRQITDRECLIAYIEVNDDAKLPSGATGIHAGDVLGIVTLEKHIPHFLELAGSPVRAFNKIALVGAGRIGAIIAENLAQQQQKKNLFSRYFKIRKAFGKEFVIIDKDDDRAKAAAEKFPFAHVFRADVTDDGFLVEEGIAAFDLVICATHNHELNIVVSGYLKSLGVQKTITLVGSEEFAQIARNIGTDVAIPLKDAVVDTILGRLRGKSVTGIHTISNGDLEIIEYELLPGAKVAGKALKEIAVPGVFLVIEVKKKNAPAYVIPDGNTVLEPGDEVAIIAQVEGNEKVLERFG
ncbi:MAG: Trk system potassium transporter TrkA [Spirochaetaceae bacterium]|jgi:trk system potassium uptake protein TrkA|nr:Trk system potassium transporter TrkA [Spirochaetaceae bacterium]